ncbi:MAG: flavin reductase [Oscillospiraceae bacterium]|jgi:flavin reductase (DIM6/NTAB) family NADH-FMN oxidoreductase RutF|nr:flavin reductase [Oscillospiraceae bacterium]
MKIEIGQSRPANFREMYPGELSFSSHFECGAVVPNVLSLITTLKENGKYNACFYAGTTFAGNEGKYYVILPGMGQSHTYANILRDREFCVNFISSKYYKACGKTIEHNDDGDDEISEGGFTAKPCKTIKAPRIEESIVSFECRLVSAHDIAGDGKSVLYIGEVQLAHVEENSHLLDRICGPDGFMVNINSAQNLLSEERMPYGAAYLTPFEV